MKTFNLFLIIWLLFTSSNCKKNNCHTSIKIINKSNTEVIGAIIANGIIDGVNKCKMDGDTIGSDNHINYQPFNHCIEKEMDKESLINYYIIDVDEANKHNAFHSCDSVEIKNDILQKYSLTLADLKAKDFTIIYE